MFSLRHQRGSYSSGAYACHRSPSSAQPVSSMCLRAKRPPEDTRWRSSRASAAPQKDQSGSAADWPPPKSGDQEDDGRLPSDEGNRPSARAEWTVALRYGHFRSAPVVVCGGVRTEREPPPLRAALWFFTRPT